MPVPSTELELTTATGGVVPCAAGGPTIVHPGVIVVPVAYFSYAEPAMIAGSSKLPVAMEFAAWAAEKVPAAIAAANERQRYVFI